jgi:hypothetical protein
MWIKRIFIKDFNSGTWIGLRMRIGALRWRVIRSGTGFGGG